MNLAPIALFTYNRLRHARQTIEALQKNELAEESDLFIFSDGASSEKHIEKVKDVRNYIKTVCGFKSVTIIEREKNLGLANSIIKGVTEVVNKYGKIIVLEDDIVTTSTFLLFMNKSLDLYENNDKVISISGYVYPISYNKQEVFFIKGADCWSWATWKRGWALFNANGIELYNSIKKENKIKEFNFDNSYNYFRMLKNQIKGKNDSWAIRWYASAFLNDKLTLYPSKSLVTNIGLDDSGTHCGIDNSWGLESYDIDLDKLYVEVVMDREAYQLFVNFFLMIFHPLKRVNYIIKLIIRRLFNSGFNK